ncbi:MAG: T9SS type A sorting domain-containing protein, partial [Candidatus Zixiibacteriota bacterium]
GKGYVKIYFGSSDFDTIPEFRIVDEGNFGKSVACAGDVNNDGYDDIIVSAPSAYNPNNGAELAGKAHIYLGGSPMDTVVDVILQDSDYRYFFGSQVTSAGDVNGDNYDDVMVAATGGWDPAGRVFIYLGGEEMDSLFDIYIYGHPDSVEELGRSLTGIGDINCDNYDDILIGSPYTGFPQAPGKAEIYLGGNPMDTVSDLAFYGDSINYGHSGRVVASAGDVNGDGIMDILVSRGAGGWNSKLLRSKLPCGDLTFDTFYLWEEPVSPTAFGLTLSTAGDLNKDGFADIIIGDYQSGKELKGKVHIFFGGSEMDSSADIILIGDDREGEKFGVNVAYIGDINGDSYDEISVSSYYDSSHIGKVFVFTSYATLVNDQSNEHKMKYFNLFQNYPNPFNPETIIEYVLPENAQVDVSVYNILGKHVTTLIDQYQISGYKKATWDGKNQAGSEVSSGVYFYRLKTDSFIEVKKMLMLK